MSALDIARPTTYRYCRRSGPAGRSAHPTIETNRILIGDALTVLRSLPYRSIDSVITSPPYFLLRNYGVADQLGTESTVDEYASNIVAVCDEIARVLQPSGTLWLNLGDSYSRHTKFGSVPKSLLLAPERILLQLSQRGWIVRNKVVWAKPNPMPSSVRDRLSCTWEPIYMLVRSERYWFDLDAVRMPHTTLRKPSRVTPAAKYGGKRPAWAGPLAGLNDGLTRAQIEGRSGHPFGKNPGDVWTIATAGFRGAHFATFPVQLIERPILATVPERVCSQCATPWKRVDSLLVANCTCGAESRPGVVLDPFIGAGTVAVAAERHGRDWLGIEINPAYAELARQRIAAARRKRVREDEMPVAA